MNVTVEDHSAEVIAEKNDAIDRALEAIGQQAVGYAKLLAPVDTGLLRNSLTHAVSGKPTAITEYKASKGDGNGTYSGSAPDDEEAVYVGTNVEYAPYVEYGTRRSAAQPFLKPAVVDHADEYKKIAKKYLKGD